MKKNYFLKFKLPAIILSIALFSCTGVNEPEPELTQKRSVKRGVSYGFQIPQDDARLLSKGASWFYNWGPNISETLNNAALANKLEFFPMAWNGNFNSDQIRSYKQAHPECEYILAYNEPNLTDQANMTPQQAAQNWPLLKSLADELGMKIISPAMNYGTLSGYSDPIVWLDEFFTLVPLSDIDGIAVHCYMGNASALAWFVNRFKKYDKPIWLTEFCAWENNIKSITDQMRFMSDAINYLEADDDVVKYAWFIPRASGSLESYPYMQLLTKSTPYQLSALGKVFANMSTQDKSVFYPEGQQIPAEHYSSLNMAETVKTGTYSNSVRLRPTTDETGELEVCDFYTGFWLEYQVDIRSKGNQQIEFRYASTLDATIELLVDKTDAFTFDLTQTGSENTWVTTSKAIDLSKGKHTLRIKMNKGGLVLNWIRINSK